MFKYIYWILSLILYILALPLLFYKKREERYKETIPARFFLKNNPSFKKEGIWFHSCSLGETRGLKPIIDRLGNETINMSVVTNTGYQEAENFSKNVRYLPFELFLPFWITKQKILIVTEAEYWYMLFFIAKLKGAKTILINSRISEKNYKNYKKYNWFYSYIFNNIDKIFAQSELDKQRLLNLGIKKDIEVTGNSKLVNLPKITKNLIKSKDRLIVGSSTHETEEQIILDAWDRSQGVLVIVPRHPERFDEVEELINIYIKDTNLTYHRFSSKEDFDADIILVDKMGELINIYAISDVVILGGGFIYGTGGHNPIEVAYFANNILITGELIYNQTSLYESINNHYIIKNDELKNHLNKIDKLKIASLTQKGTIEPIIKYINKSI
ncbi:MAG: lipid IV(A) 3-deoxy-D-manno-octulosonic acid transferase [Campylobacterota bacterium]|nr:lipid IV(A) 3-deoxy-D-manno-octulosonic acid transferase [Campylobacterota bacterium]